MRDNITKTGVILINIGTPDSPTKASLKHYLAEFLVDDKVIEFPSRIVWKLILHIFILNIYPKKSAAKYAKIWNSFGSGSPLLNISKLQLLKLKELLREDNLEFELGMRYGNPSIKHALKKLKTNNCKKIIVLPLYPQYSNTTTGSVFSCVSAEISTWRNVPELVFVQSYNQNSLYIKALADSIRKHQQIHNKPDLLIMSYHGVPQHYIDNGDVYYSQCLQTSSLLAKMLDLKNSEYKVSFQSIFGKQQWIKPYTSSVLKEIVVQGVIKHVQVICPGFAADCLETLEEINIENRDNFTTSGNKFSYISALNDNDDHIRALSNIVENYL